jgi:hypothetical protein
MNITRLLCCSIVLFVTFSIGCTKTFYIKPPALSSVSYDQKNQKETTLKIDDKRIGEDNKVSKGTLNVVLMNIEDIRLFLGENIEKELISRGINIKYKSAGEQETGLLLSIRKFQIRNQRTSGLSPYWTFTTFRGDLIMNGTPHEVAFYFKKGKVPVWAFREVEDPCYNVPLSIMTNEIAAKINYHYFGLRASTEQINKLLDDINNNFNEMSFLKVLELGYTNNKDAIGPLTQLADHNDSMVRVCAICSLGVLGAVEKLDFLKNIYNTRKNIEKSMALKAIGDLNTGQGFDFIKSVKTSSDYNDDMIHEVVDLYL